MVAFCRPIRAIRVEKLNRSVNSVEQNSTNSDLWRTALCAILIGGDNPVTQVKGATRNTPGDAPAHQPGALEEADVLGDGVERHVERRRQLGDARFAHGEPLEDGAAGLVGQRDQGVVQVHGAYIHPNG